MEALILNIKPVKIVEHVVVTVEIDNHIIKADCTITKHTNEENAIIYLSFYNNPTPEEKKVVNALVHRKYVPKYIKSFPYSIENFCTVCYTSAYEPILINDNIAYLKCKKCNNLKPIRTYGF